MQQSLIDITNSTVNQLITQFSTQQSSTNSTLNQLMTQFNTQQNSINITNSTLSHLMTQFNTQQNSIASISNRLNNITFTYIDTSFSASSSFPTGSSIVNLPSSISTDWLLSSGPSSGSCSFSSYPTCWKMTVLKNVTALFLMNFQINGLANQAQLQFCVNGIGTYGGSFASVNLLSNIVMIRNLNVNDVVQIEFWSSGTNSVSVTYQLMLLRISTN